MSFLGSSEIVPIRTQRVPQTIETPVTFVPQVPNAYVRFAYSRSSDSIANQIEGQDYLCLQHNDQRLVFVVADGVGSSFCGNLAARLLGDGLLEWLWALDIAYLGGAEALSEAASSFLNRLQKHAQHEVEDYEIPGQMSPLVRQALEAQRAYGSEAIFAACRVDHPGPLLTEGLISVFWMGDTQIHVLDEDGQLIDIGGTWDNVNRWSTARGTRGVLHAWMHSLKGIGRIVSFTDGLSAHAPALLTYADSKLDREIHLGARLPTSDDVAIIDVVLRTPRYEGYPDPDLPDPGLERPHLEQIWNPTGANTYELRWSWPGQGNKLSYILQEATNPALTDARTIDVPPGQTSWRPSAPQPPGHYYYRLRAVKRFGGLTPWSELRQTKVAYPPPPAPKLCPVEPGKAPVLVWEGEGEALEYTLERSATPDFSAPEVVFEGRSTSWSVPTDRPGTFFYRVRATSDGGPGPWSEVQQVEVVMPPPPRPHLATASYGYEHGSFELRWQPVPTATYYELEQSTYSSTGEATIIRLEDTIYQVTEQEVGEYVFRVRACHERGCSEWSNDQIVIVAPQPPAGAPLLTASGPDAEGVIRLEWTEVPKAEVYLVEVSDSQAFENARMYSQPDTTLKLTRREPGAYCFRVCASNQGGDGPWSNVCEVAIVPNAPAWIEATLSQDRKHVTLAWGAVGGRVSYRLEATSGKEVTPMEVYHGEETQCDLPLPTGVEPLRFRVRAEAADVYSEWTNSEPVQIRPAPERPALEPPEIDEAGQVRLRWGKVEDADYYVMEAARDKDFTDLRSVRVEKTSINFHPPASGQYYFRVRACARAGETEMCGDPSNVVWVQVRRPAAPRLWPLDPVKAKASFEITWTGVPGCIYYELQESTNDQFAPDATKTLRIFHPEQKLVLLEGRPAGQYFFRVKAVDENNQPSLWSNVLVVEAQP